MASLRKGIFQFTKTERVIYGEDVTEIILDEVKHLKAKKVFLLVSSTLLKHTKEIERVKLALGDSYVGLFSGIPPHAPRTAVLKAAQNAANQNADLIITIGGGSVTDAGKIMPICMENNLSQHDDLEPYHYIVNEDGSLTFPDFIAPKIRVISIPTTLSGGEFNPLSGATDEKRKIKQGYIHPLLVPVVVILDPKITVHTPEWLWLSTGVRALDHAMETLGSFKSNDYCDGLAESAIRLLVDGLKRVKKNPSDLDARLKCQIGVWQSMVPVVSGVPMGASHAIGHVLGGTFDVPHGHTSCVMAPYVLKFNETVNGGRQKRISNAFGKPQIPAWELADEFIKSLGMPRRLTEVGVTADKLETVANYTMEDLWARTNPRKITKADDVLEILKTAL